MNAAPMFDPPLPWIATPQAVGDAALLIRCFGRGAAEEAALRAGRSRDIGNVAHFCHWRQIERLIHLLTAERAAGTVH